MNAIICARKKINCPLTFHLMFQSFRLNILCCAEGSPHPSYSEEHIGVCFWLVPQNELFNELFISLTGPAHRGPSQTQAPLLSLRGWESSQNNRIVVLESCGFSSHLPVLSTKTTALLCHDWFRHRSSYSAATTWSGPHRTQVKLLDGIFYLYYHAGL